MDGIVWIVLAYFIGAIPSGYMIGRVFYGVNLKKVGSGNIGATNAYRELGAVAGLSVFICDFLKGFLAVHLGMPDPTLVLACAIFVIVGNDWSVFLKFKSGKGVACGVGAFAISVLRQCWQPSWYGLPSSSGNTSYPLAPSWQRRS